MLLSPVLRLRIPRCAHETASHRRWAHIPVPRRPTHTTRRDLPSTGPGRWRAADHTPLKHDVHSWPLRAKAAPPLRARSPLVHACFHAPLLPQRRRLPCSTLSIRGPLVHQLMPHCQVVWNGCVRHGDNIAYGPAHTVTVHIPMGRFPQLAQVTWYRVLCVLCLVSCVVCPLSQNARTYSIRAFASWMLRSAAPGDHR